MEGLTKKQVKQIVKITGQKHLSTRPYLQGLGFNQAENVWYATDGYVLCYWKMDNVDFENLPCEDGIVFDNELKRWLATAKNSDELRWGDLVSMITPHSVVNPCSLLKDSIKDEAHQGSLNPRLLEMLTPLFPDKVEYDVANWQDRTTAIRLTAKGEVEQVGLALGLTD